MKAILYIGHGTRSKKGAQEQRSFLERVMKRTNAPIQEICFLKLTDPSIADGFERCVNRGATEITVVPLFMLAAGHIKEDIPHTLSAIQKRHPNINVNITNPLGVQDRILDVVTELVKATVTDITSQDSILIVGVGGSDPDVPATFTEITNGIQERLGVDSIIPCFLAARNPGLDEGLTMISQKAKGRIIVIPYLLFSGILFQVIKQKVSERQKTGQEISLTVPLSEHRLLEDIFIEPLLDKDVVIML